jgi:uncharacterized protein (DUF1697 family)
VQTERVRVAALLRGVNLGKRRIAMPELRAIVEALGHEDVETYLQSGNAVFTPSARAPKDLAGSLATAISDAAGFDVPVVVRTGRELGRVVSRCPYAVDDPTRLVVAFLSEPVELDALGLGDLDGYRPDELTLAGSELYVRVPTGQARSKLMERLTTKPLPVTLTVRNWRTVSALAELAR